MKKTFQYMNKTLHSSSIPPPIPTGSKTLTVTVTLYYILIAAHAPCGALTTLSYNMVSYSRVYNHCFSCCSLSVFLFSSYCPIGI